MGTGNIHTWSPVPGPCLSPVARRLIPVPYPFPAPCPLIPVPYLHLNAAMTFA